jgi:DNA-binding Lrp family transcriptional regulator
MEGYWDGIDKEILEVLTAGGPMDPVDLARSLGMSTGAVCSCLSMLSAEGKVRIRRVEATPAPLSLVRAA